MLVPPQKKNEKPRKNQNNAQIAFWIKFHQQWFPDSIIRVLIDIFEFGEFLKIFSATKIWNNKANAMRKRYIYKSLK